MKGIARFVALATILVLPRKEAEHKTEYMCRVILLWLLIQMLGLATAAVLFPHTFN